MSGCVTCAKPLGRGNKTGYCRGHVNQAVASPERSAAIRAGLVLYYSDPVNKQRARENIIRNSQTEHAKQRRSDTAKAIGLHMIGQAAITADPAILERRARSQSNTKMAWCPRELRAEYKRLVRTKKLPASEARAIILDQHERDMQTFRRDVLGVAA